MSNTILRQLNDAFRTTMTGGEVEYSDGVLSLGSPDVLDIVEAVRAFEAFDYQQEPHSTHDWGTVEVNGQRYRWKIEYKSKTGSTFDPCEPNRTTRVLWIRVDGELL